MKTEILGLSCKKCGQLLNYNYFIKADVSKLDYEDDKELLEVDQFIEVNEVEYNLPFNEGIMVNTKAVTLKDHQNSKLFCGCCGPSMRSELNQCCPTCGYEIGLLIADCWMPHFIGIDSSKVFTRKTL